MKYMNEFKDNCGFGLLAQLDNIPSHRLVSDAVHALSKMMHRGAVAADGKTGDGSGLLCSMPYDYMREKVAEVDISLPEVFAVAVIFFTDFEVQKSIFQDACHKNDLKVVLFREVPMDIGALGEYAIDMMPKVVQAFVIPSELVATRRLDALLFLTRKEVEQELSEDENFCIPSFSRNTISYKGLVMPTFIEMLYPDLKNENFKVTFALFHQRFSTNTLPRWKLAQPFRFIAHNGEFNSIKANRFNTRSKFLFSKSDVFTEKELGRISSILESGVSDSASIDNFLEYLLINDTDIFKAIRSVIPPARHNVASIPAKLRSFYEYTSSTFEPWDGPAAVSFTNGRYIGCVLDRNGLRPAKYVITTENRLLISSEYGILGTPPEKVKKRGRLQSGQMIAADLDHGKVFFSEDIDEYLMNSLPYGDWLTENTYYLQEFIERQFDDLSDYSCDNLIEFQRYFNYTAEILDLIIKPMLSDGKEAIGSMGDDTPQAAFSDVQRNFTDFFRQKFAQVTNPPIDPLREKAVMSTTIGFGVMGNVFEETPERAKRLKSISPILSKDILDALFSFGDEKMPRFEPCYKYSIFYTGFTDNLENSLKSLGQEIIRAVQEDKVRIVVLDDRVLNIDKNIIPMALVVGYLNQLLVTENLRSLVSIVAISGEVMDSHSACVLIGYGAVGIYPWLLYTTGVDMCNKRECGVKETQTYLRNIYDSVTKGILKIMSKMGISTVSSYRNAALFDIIGLSNNIIQDCFSDSKALIPGLEYADIETRLKSVHKKIYKQSYMKPIFPLEIGGFYKSNYGFEYHDFNSEVVVQLHRFAKILSREEYIKFRDMINGRGLKFIRDFFEFSSSNKPIAIDEVESIDDITRRFDSAAMSLGALSPEAHEALAEAMNRLGGKSNCGEGGESPKRFKSPKNSKIKQIASGRFGVTPGYLRSAEEIQIKLAQGAKPGEGGQLPGNKVTSLIASLRFTIPGVTLISPPPHHDIYSIEDLAQLIFDLKQVNPDAIISVKLVSTDGVGTIAAGVAKAYADKIIISGADGGTGAAQFNSIKYTGNPWEVGLVEAHNSLKGNNLRQFVQLQTDGGLKTGRDVVKAAMLGAEYFGFGTSLLVILGCKILRVCHLNRCTVGIATQDKNLREHYAGTVEKVVTYLQNIAEDIREILASLGVKSINEIVGRSDLLKLVDDPRASKFDFSSILERIDGEDLYSKKNEVFDDNAFEKAILKDIFHVIRNPKEEIIIEKEINNTNRSFGALISGEIAKYYGDEGLPRDAITLRLRGVAGQSFGAFLINGVNLYLDGVGNDYVGKGMNNGRIVIVPTIYQEGAAALGNTCLYGATGGKLFAAGIAGERFAVRNSGALAIVEGTGDHACEYMTGGTVVVLGETGINFGAGMTGGVAFVYDRNSNFIDKLNQDLVEIRRVAVDDDNEGKLYLKKILVSYINKTSSPKAKYIIDNFRDELTYFWMVTPKGMKAPLNPKEGG